MDDIFLRNMNERGVIEGPIIQIIDDYRISTYLSPNLKDAILQLPEESWLMGVQYADKNDIQIGISGSYERSKDGRDVTCFENTARRETVEELGLMVDKLEQISDKQNEKRHIIFKAHVLKTTIFDFKSKKKAKRNKQKITTKVWILVYGSKNEMYSTLANLKCVDGGNADKLSAVAIYSRESALYWIDFLSQNK